MQQLNILRRVGVVMRSFLVSSIFVCLSIALVSFTHHFYLAGQIFLPMHFFIFVAGLVFGWRVGVLTGFLTPIVSFMFSGMPLIGVLPQIMIELVAYGFFVGFFKHKLNMNNYASLILAMVAGKLFLGLAVLIFQDMSPVNYVWVIIKTGYVGLMIQLLLVVPTVIYINKWITPEK